MIFEIEQKTYEENKSKLLAFEGYHVLIRGKDIIAICKDYEMCMELGCKTYCMYKPFMIKEIKAQEDPILITRMLGV